MERKAPLRRTGFASRGEPLKRTPMKRSPRPRRRRAISPASPEQRAKCTGKPCVACGSEFATVPMHLIDRSLGGDDDPRATVPGCPTCHRAYDEGGLSILEYLEPHYREEVAYAVQLVGLISALRRITNTEWREERRGERAA